MLRENIKSIEPQRSAEEQWKQAIQDANDKTLLPLTDSWYMGANIPGKKREQLNYLGGIKNYEHECRAALRDLNGFTVVYHSDKSVNGVCEAKTADDPLRLRQLRGIVQARTDIQERME